MSESRGHLVVKTAAMPADTNANGDIFGGWLLSQMDIGGGVMAFRCAGQRVATVAVDSMIFHRPVKVGSVLSCYAKVTKTGRSSITIQVSAWVMDKLSWAEEQVTEGTFTFVAIDHEGKPNKSVNWQVPE